MNSLATQPRSQFSGSQESALTIELAKMLGLVAPISMSADQQTLWLASAVDALHEIRADEVAAVSAEVRRGVTRPSQIVPEIARLVSAKRARPMTTENPLAGKAWAIEHEAQRRRLAVSAKDKRALSEIYDWERKARIDAGLHVEPYPKPLNRHELSTMKSDMRQLGLTHGFLEYRGEELVETPSIS